MRRLLRRCGVASALALLVAAPTQAAVPRSYEASAVAAQLRTGKTVVLSDAVISGELDLRVAVVRGSFKCRGCRLGSILASDATFERTLDVTDSTFAGIIDFTGATFRGPALFRASPDGELVFERRVDFSLAVFENIASFSDARFGGAASFEDARFAEVAFALAIFDAPASFGRSSFEGSASFNGAEFSGPVGFAESDFRERADFSITRFERGGTFSKAQFGRDASFLGAVFRAPNRTRAGERTALQFDGVVASGNLDFTFTTFEFVPAGARAAGTSAVMSRPRQIANFDEIVCGRSVLLGQTKFEYDDRFDARVSMTRLRVTDLVLEVDEAHRVGDDSDRLDVLASIEESAKARDDLSVANDAHFELRKLRSETYDPVARVLDVVFYRSIAGYFVRPFRPLLILVIAATIVASWRYVRGRRTHSDESSLAAGQGRWHWRFWRQCEAFLTSLLDTFALAIPGRGRSGSSAAAFPDRILAIGFRVLLVCALIGLANSNPTLRDMVDTLL
jgi:uncharacterized protein YjbI with pentapeptide repeats